MWHSRSPGHKVTAGTSGSSDIKTFSVGSDFCANCRLVTSLLSSKLLELLLKAQEQRWFEKVDSHRNWASLLFSC